MQWISFDLIHIHVTLLHLWPTNALYLPSQWSWYWDWICTQVGGWGVGGIWAFFHFLEMFCIPSVDWTKVIYIEKNTLAILFLVGTSLSQNPETLSLMLQALDAVTQARDHTSYFARDRTVRWSNSDVIWSLYTMYIMVILVGCSLHPVILFSHLSFLALLDVDQLITTRTATIRNNVNKNRNL